MADSLSFRISSSSLMKFALPTILSTIFMNVYSLVDSLFVANLVGTDALSAVNIAGPFLAVALAVGTMIATGGSALVGKELGEGRKLKAKENFSFFLLFCTLASIIFTIAGIAFRHPLLYAMGADDTLYTLCEAYAVPLFIAVPAVMCSILIEIFLVTAGRPGLSFALSFAGGVTNIVLDWLLIGVFGYGVAGAAWATGAGYILQSIIGICFFAFRRNESLTIVKPKCSFREFCLASGNGASEMMGMLAVTVTMVTMNTIMMRISGSDGVAASAVVLAAQSILSSLYMGYSQGIAPVISYNCGSGNSDNMKRIFRYALITIAVLSLLTFALTYLSARPLAALYADGNENVTVLSVRGIRVSAPAFLFMGFNLFASSFFTSLNDGRTSALLAFMRTLVFLMLPLLVLPLVFGTDGVWLSIPAAEILGFLMAVICFRRMKSVYNMSERSRT